MTMQTVELEVTEDQHGQRLDKFLTSCLEGQYSRQKIQEYIREGQVTVNGSVQTTPKTAVVKGNVVCARVPVVATRLTPCKVAFDVLYEDANLAIINKPAGLVVHPEHEDGLSDDRVPTLAHGLLDRFPQLLDEESLRPGVVHRLDKDTSGLLAVGLSAAGREGLQELFAERAVNKEYLALVHGVPEQEAMVIDLPIGRHPFKKTCMAVVEGGREALSSYRVLYASSDGAFSLLAVSIITGRTHQIRVHLSAIGHPLIGDRLYTSRDNIYDSLLETPLSATLAARRAKETPLKEADVVAPRQMLHAWRLGMPLVPEGVRVQLPAVTLKDGFCKAQCPPPEDFIALLGQLLRRPVRVVVTGMPGSGKSSLVQDLQEMGVPCFSADHCVRELYGPDGDGARLLRMRYGDAYVDERGVNKQALGQAMRDSDTLRREIEGLIHPLVFHALKEFWQRWAASPLAVAEIPLYFETAGGVEATTGAPLVDYVVGVSCPFKVRAERLQVNRGWDAETISGMEAWQLSETEKMSRCHMVVPNSGDRETLRGKARKLYEQILSEQQKKVDEQLAVCADVWSGPW